MKTRKVTFTIQLHICVCVCVCVYKENELPLQLLKLFSQFSACPSTETKKIVLNYGSHQGSIVAASM